MPDFVNPLLKLTKSQRDRLLERIVRRASGKSAMEASIGDVPERMIGSYRARVGELGRDVPTIARPEGRGTMSPLDALLRQEPAEERAYGRLKSLEEGRQGAIETYPWPEAKLRFLKDAENKYEPVNVAGPTAKRVLGVPPESLRDITRGFAVPTSSEIKPMDPAGLAYERMRFKPIENVTERLARQTRGVEEMGPTIEVPPGKLAKIDQSESRQRNALINDMWSQIGGMRTAAGKQWEILRMAKKQRHNYANAKDYFIRIATHWLDNPQKIAEKYPKEASLLDALFNTIKD